MNIYSGIVLADRLDYIRFFSSLANAGGRRECFSLIIADDELYEEDLESFTVLLRLESFVMQSGILIQPNVSEIFIEDDDGEFLKHVVRVLSSVCV